MSAIRTPMPDAAGGPVSFGSTLQGHGPPSDDEWRWADVTGQQRLVNSDELRAALASGVIAPNTPVWRRGWRDWRAAYDVPELTTSALAAANGILPNIPPPPLAMVAVQREFEADAAHTPKPSKVEAPPPPAYAPAPSRQGQSVSHAPAPQLSQARGSRRPPSVQPPPNEAPEHHTTLEMNPRTTEPFPALEGAPVPIEPATIVNVRALTDRDLERIAGKAEPKPRPAAVVIPAISLAARTEGPPRAKSVAPPVGAFTAAASASSPPPPSVKPATPSRKPPPPQAAAASVSKPPPPKPRPLAIEEIDVDDPVDEELSGSLLLPDLPPASAAIPRTGDSVEELSASALVAEPSIIAGASHSLGDLSGGFMLRAEASDALALGAVAQANVNPAFPAPAPDPSAEAKTLVRQPAPVFEAATLVRQPAPPVSEAETLVRLPSPGISAFAASAGSAPPPSFAPAPSPERAYQAPSFPPAPIDFPSSPTTIEHASTFDSSFSDDEPSASPGHVSVSPGESQSQFPRAFLPKAGSLLPQVKSLLPRARAYFQRAPARPRSPGVLAPPEGLGILPFKVPAVAPLALVFGLAVVGLLAALFSPVPEPMTARQAAPEALPAAEPAPASPVIAPVQGAVATSTAALEPAPVEAPAQPIVATPSTAACVLVGGARSLAPTALVASGVEVQAIGKRVGVGFVSTPRDGFAFAVDPASLAVTHKVHARASEPIRRVTPVNGPHGFDAIANVDAASALEGRRTVAGDPPLDLGVANHAIAWSPSHADTASTLWPLEGDGAVDAFRATPIGTLAGDGWAIVFRQGSTLYAGVTTGGAHPSARGPLVKAVGLGAQVGSPAIGSADGVVFVAWADRSVASDPWGLRWLRFPIGATTAEAHAFALPAGGLGGQAMSPGVAAVGAGRFLLLWTEGPVASHQVRGQTLDAQGAPLGAPLTLSAAGRNAGQGQAAFLPDGRGLVAYLEARDASAAAFEVVASSVACKP